MKYSGSILSFLLVVVSSCSHDDHQDFRDQATGNYTYTSQLYVLDGTSISSLGDYGMATGNFVLEKNDRGIQIRQNNKVQFVGTHATQATNGFAFTIEPQSFTGDGGAFTINGYDHVTFTVSGIATKYHGGYFSSGKKLEAWFTFVTTDPDTGMTLTYVASIIGVKV
jgi:hypothetical protein